MPLLPRAARPLEQLAAADRVRGLLDRTQGWVPPVDDDSAPPAAAAGEPAARPADTTPAAPAGHAAPSAPGLLDLLRGGRLDPGRRAVWGLAVVALLACLVAAVVLLRGRPHEVAPPVVERAGSAIPGAELSGASPGSAAELAAPTPGVAPAAGAGTEVVVAVAGRVRRPGVVRLAAGSRVDDAVRAAGGLVPGASPGLLNLARRLVDGEQVLVGVEQPPGGPTTGAPAGPTGATGGAAGGAVDLNTATVADLDALPGIGPVLAQRILEHRTANGPFRSVDQLREVSGIGEAKYAQLKDAVRV